MHDTAKSVYRLLGVVACVILFVRGATAAPTATPPPANPANSAVAEARKRVAEAQKAVDEIKAEQKRIKDKRVSDYSDKEEWKNTAPALAKAKKEYDAAKRQALLAMKNSDQYKKTLKDRDALQAKLEALQKSQDPDPKQIASIGSAIANDGIALKKMETSAIESDGKTAELKEALDKAEKDMKTLEDEVETSLQSDPEYAQLQTQIDQGQVQLTQAKDALAQTIKSQAASHPRPAPAAKPPKQHHSAPRRSMGGGY